MRSPLTISRNQVLSHVQNRSLKGKVNNAYPVCTYQIYVRYNPGLLILHRSAVEALQDSIKIGGTKHASLALRMRAHFEASSHPPRSFSDQDNKRPMQVVEIVAVSLTFV